MKKKAASFGSDRAATLLVVFGCLLLVLATCGKDDAVTAPPTPAPKPVAGPCVIVCSAGSQYRQLALAFSPSSRACGWAEGSSPDAAKKGAVSACGWADCVPVVWGYSGVGAVAANNVAYGWGWEKHVSSLAEAEAIAHCQSRTP